MIDTDKYEGLTIDDWYKMNHHDWKDVVNEYDDLLAEVKRLQKENQRYLDFIFRLGIEHKGKELAWEYGDEKLVEMIE